MALRENVNASSRFVPVWTVRHSECPLEALVRKAIKLANSTIGKMAINRFGLYSQGIIRHLTDSIGSLDCKLRTLPDAANGSPNRNHLRAIDSVLVFAVLSRFEEWAEQKKELCGLQRSFINPSGTDLLQEFQLAWSANDDERLISLIKSESRYFLCNISNEQQLESTIRKNVQSFRKVSAEAAVSGPMI